MTAGLVLRVGVALGALVMVAGCGQAAKPVAPPVQPSAEATAPNLPARPAELRLDGVDPCTLLTDPELRQLGVRQTTRAADGDEFGSPDCQWSNLAGKPDNAWLVRLITKRGAEYGLGSETGAHVIQVDGFPTVQTWAGGVDRATHCILLVDVAPGQSLWAQYDNLAGDYPGISPEKSCQLATQGAELMMRNLRRLSH